MNEKTVNITNYIGIYDNYITKEECNKAIQFYENQNKFSKTVNRLASEKMSILNKQDQQYFMGSDTIDVWWESFKPMIHNFDLAFKHYCENVGAFDAYGQDKFFYTGMKIQKTLPTEGYHVWHIEHGRGFDSEPRAFVFSIYLNDVEEGGETEFLNFSKRVQPKTGRVVIWPAGFPYVHRGNPPLKGEKYILTSWMLLR
jgi:hypothetical protein